MRTLYTLLVAINDYDQPEEINNLKGCLNDLQSVENLLDSYAALDPDLTLQKKVLKNNEATRRAVIEGFSLFKQAAEEDVCLFYYSGHGAQIDAPAQFWTEHDQKLEALVLYKEKGDDNLLIDQELSYLIAESQQGTKSPFVAITDCCHAGSNTKTGLFQVRNVPDNLNNRPIEQYEGVDQYESILDESGAVLQLSPPQGKHIKLGACHSHQLAKELALGQAKMIRGVFTYALVRVLKQHGFRLSYIDLIQKTRILARRLTTDQSPQIESVSVPSQTLRGAFISGILEGAVPTYQVYYGDRGWMINAGELSGLSNKDRVILAEGTETHIQTAGIGKATLNSDNLIHLEQGKIYEAQVIFAAKNKLRLTFTEEANMAQRGRIEAVHQEQKSSLISIDSYEDADYLIDADQTSIRLINSQSGNPVIPPLRGETPMVAIEFYMQIQHIATWKRVTNISNTSSDFHVENIKIALSHVVAPFRHPNPDMANTTPIDRTQSELVFRYALDESGAGLAWHPPEFRLSIENTSPGQIFWVSALYCGVGYIAQGRYYNSTLFSIVNRFLENARLEANKQIDMIDTVYEEKNNAHINYKSIQLNILDDYFEYGLNEMKDMIKIIVATEEFDTNQFVMNGIPLKIKGAGSEKDISMAPDASPDWRTYELPVTIVKPRDMGMFDSRLPKQLFGVKLCGHPRLTGRVILSTMEEFIRSTQLLQETSDISHSHVTKQPKYMQRPEIYFGSGKVKVIDLTKGLGDVEGCSVIELFRSNGTQAVTPEEPLVIELDETVIGDYLLEQICMLGYMEAERAYYRLGTLNTKRQIIINKLPPPAFSPIEGLGNSIKLFLIQASPSCGILDLPENDQLEIEKEYNLWPQE